MAVEDAGSHTSNQKEPTNDSSGYASKDAAQHDSSHLKGEHQAFRSILTRDLSVG